ECALLSIRSCRQTSALVSHPRTPATNSSTAVLSPRFFCPQGGKNRAGERRKQRVERTRNRSPAVYSLFFLERWKTTVDFRLCATHSELWRQVHVGGRRLGMQPFHDLQVGPFSRPAFSAEVFRLAGTAYPAS